MTPRQDIQSLFEANADRGDFLNAAQVDNAIGLCLSGGGYRAMLYHLGALQCLNGLGFLSQLKEIASVSGGSITAGVLACAWDRLQFDDEGVAANFDEEVAGPIEKIAGVGIDVRAALLGLVPGRTGARGIAEAYDRYLFRGATLQDLPDRPRFTFMATNLQTGSGWRFAKSYAADYRVGRINNPEFPIATVVAASSAFPPFLSPLRLPFGGHVVERTEGADLHLSPFTEGAVLTDGGVYDNLGLERVWKRCRTIFVSNAGRNIPELGMPTGRWTGQIFRTLGIVQQQAENSRRRMLFGMANRGERRVAYWSIDTPVSAYAEDCIPLGADSSTKKIATMRTRLNPFTAKEVQVLRAAGYDGAEASLYARGFVGNGVRAGKALGS